MNNEIKTVKIDLGSSKLELPSLLELPYGTYKYYRIWIKTWFEIQQTKSLANAEDFEAQTDALIDTLIETLPEYAEATKKFSYKQHIELLVKWLGIESKEQDPEKLKEALEALGK